MSSWPIGGVCLVTSEGPMCAPWTTIMPLVVLVAAGIGVVGFFCYLIVSLGKRVQS